MSAFLGPGLLSGDGLHRPGQPALRSTRDRAALSGVAFTALDQIVVVQLFLFGVVELALFRRDDFVSMRLFRLCDYGTWHLLCGTLRVA